MQGHMLGDPSAGSCGRERMPGVIIGHLAEGGAVRCEITMTLWTCGRGCSGDWGSWCDVNVRGAAESWRRGVSGVRRRNDTRRAAGQHPGHRGITSRPRTACPTYRDLKIPSPPPEYKTPWDSHSTPSCKSHPQYPSSIYAQRTQCHPRPGRTKSDIQPGERRLPKEQRRRSPEIGASGQACLVRAPVGSYGGAPPPSTGAYEVHGGDTVTSRANQKSGLLTGDLGRERGRAGEGLWFTNLTWNLTWTDICQGKDSSGFYLNHCDVPQRISS